MAVFRVTIMLKPGVLDAPGQAVEQGLRALGYEIERARIGKIVELAVPEAVGPRLNEICERFLANPLVETWRIEGPQEE